MPTAEECQELLDNTWRPVLDDTTEVVQTFFEKRQYSTYVSFPCAGWYEGGELGQCGTDGFHWASTYRSPGTAYVLYVYRFGGYMSYNPAPAVAYNVRAVLDPIP